jgi:hypothetical protein
MTKAQGRRLKAQVTTVVVTVAWAVGLAAQQGQAQGGGSDLSTNVNLGGGSSWRGTVPTGPVPRLPDGTVDLTGVWQGGGPGGSNGGLERGLAKGETIPILPAAKEKMAARGPLDNTEALCLPAGVPRVPSNYPWRMVQTPSHKAATHIFMLFEANIHSFRQIFMDGRKHPADLDLTWYGHSIGWWEGDTLVVDTIGFNDRHSLDGNYPGTTQKHIIERWTRRDLGHMVNEITIDDPGAYARPFKVTFPATLRSGDELMEYICNENNQIGIAGGYIKPQ